MMVIFDHAADFPLLRTELIHRSADRILRVFKTKKTCRRGIEYNSPIICPVVT
jgi:hypothetical protein